jgi:sec-independent protein translocase protein TatC
MTDLQKLLRILGEGRHRLFRILLVLGPMFGFFLTFRFAVYPWSLGPWTIPILYPVFGIFNNTTAQVFRGMVAWMLPSSVQLLNVGVGDSVFVQLEIAILLTLIFGMPWIVHETAAFLVPALRRSERDLIRRIGGPATGLFAVGALLGFFWLTPLTFRILFQYVAAMGIAPVVGAQQFVTFALLYSLAFGVVFELPVFVYGLTRLGVVRAETWKKHWRAAVIGSLIFGMVVTPDNSGITMVLIACPMIALYLVGVVFATRWEHLRGIPPAARAQGA